MYSASAAQASSISLRRAAVTRVNSPDIMNGYTAIGYFNNKWFLAADSINITQIPYEIKKVIDAWNKNHYSNYQNEFANNPPRDFVFAIRYYQV